MLTKSSLTLKVSLPSQPLVPLSAAYLEAGSGHPLLMLHGFLGSSHCWRSLTEQLQSDFRCISLDLLGFGDSAKPVLRYDVATEVAFVRAFVEALELSPCAVVGHSFGGWVASAYALAYPEAVSNLILVAPAGIRDDSFCGRYDHLRPLLWDTPVVDWALSLARPVAAILGQTPTLRTITGFRQSLMANPAACSFLRDRSRPEDAIDTVEQDIHRLRVPTLVITGDQDDTIPRWHSETYAQEIPDARLEVIPNADHSLPQNYSTELASVIAPFLHTHLQSGAVF